MATDLTQVQKKLWDAADELRANSGLQASEYSGPVLGLIFLRFAEERFAAAQAELGAGSARNPVGPRLGLRRGWLVYADLGEEAGGTTIVRGPGTEIVVRAVDIAGTIEQLEAGASELAREIADGCSQSGGRRAQR